MGGSASKTKYTAPAPVANKWYDDFVVKLPDQSGKVFAITGCTSGTGYAAAVAAAKKGAHVIMLNRKSERATAAQAKLADDVPGSKITAIDCDLQSFESVKLAAGMLKEQFPGGIDVLCNNAGVMALEDQATKEGYDVQMQTNHLSHFLLTREVMPLLEKASETKGEARIVNHSSLARNGKPLEAKYFDKNGGNLGGNGASMIFGGARWVRYHMSKLANVVFTLALAEKLKAAGKTKIKVVCAAPGLAATNLQVTTHVDGGMNDTWIMRWAQSAADGSMGILHCSFAEGVESTDFFEPGGMTGIPTRKKLGSQCTRLDSLKMLWEESEKACGSWTI